MFPPSTKRGIRHFHVVVAQQWRQRNEQKSVMHVQSCFLANLNLLLFCRSHCPRFCRCSLIWTQRGHAIVSVLPGCPNYRTYEKAFAVWVQFLLVRYSVIDSAQIHSVRKVGLTIYESLWLGTQKQVSVLSRLILKNIYMGFSPGHTKLSTIIYGCPWNGVPIHCNWSPPHQDICRILAILSAITNMSCMYVCINLLPWASSSPWSVELCILTAYQQGRVQCDSTVSHTSESQHLYL